MTSDHLETDIYALMMSNADYVMKCLPSCTSEDNPPKYPDMSFLQSQGVLQGE